MTSFGQLQEAPEKDAAKLRERIEKTRERERDRTRDVLERRGTVEIQSAVGGIARRNSSEIARSFRWKLREQGEKLRGLYSWC